MQILDMLVSVGSFQKGYEMEKKLSKSWNDAWNYATEITDLIRFASDGRTKKGDVNSLNDNLEKFNQVVKEAIELISAYDSCSCAEKDSQSSPQRS